MVTEHNPSQFTGFRQNAAPDNDDIVGSIAVGDIWSDTSSLLLKRCSSIGPITWVTSEGGTLTRKVVWYISGTLSTGNEQGARVEADGAWTLVDARAYVKTAPTGQAILIDLNDDGVSIFSNDLTIAAGANEDDAAHVITNASVADLSKITMDIDQVGSGAAGADLTVELEFTRSVE